MYNKSFGSSNTDCWVIRNYIESNQTYGFKQRNYWCLRYTVLKVVVADEIDFDALSLEIIICCTNVENKLTDVINGDLL